MDIRITPSSYIDKGCAVRVLMYKGDRVELEPVCHHDRTYRIVSLSRGTAAVIQVESIAYACLDEMLDYRPNPTVPPAVLDAVKEWVRDKDLKVEIYSRIRGLSDFEHSKDIVWVFYTWIRDGEYEEQVHRHRNKLRLSQ